jgi:hypothetical protein
MADAAQLTDEELNKVIETGVEPEEPESEVAAPPAEEPSKEESVEEPEVPAAEQEDGEEEAPEEKPPSRREQLRVETLLKRYGPPPEPKAPKAGKDYRELIDADDEVIKTLESDRQQSNEQSFNAGIERAKYYQWETLLKIEEKAVKANHPELDSNNKEKFHPALWRAMGAKYAAMSGYEPGDPEKGIPPSVQRPDLSYADFIESELEYADEIAALRVKQTTQNIAKQTAQTALRPDGSSAKRLNLNKAPEDMTLEELYAVTGTTPPKK